MSCHLVSHHHCGHSKWDTHVFLFFFFFNKPYYLVWLRDSHTCRAPPHPNPPTCSCLHPTASRAGQLVIHHRCLQSGLWHSGEVRMKGRRGGECVKGVRKRARSRIAMWGDRKIEVNKGKRTTETNKCFYTGWQLLHCVRVCQCAESRLLVLNHCSTRPQYTKKIASHCRFRMPTRKICASVHALPCMHAY